MSEEAVSEADCAVCGRWPRSLRPCMRMGIDTLPVQEELCDRCVEAFWANLLAEERRKH